MSPNEFATVTGVSRETLERLQTYADLLVRWQQRINLVGRDTLPDLWRRHFLDSAQLFPHISQLDQGGFRLADLGSGAGFPGLVLAAMGIPDVHLIESDTRKAAFVREAARLAGIPVTVHAHRIEAVPPLAARVVTARALAPLERLLPLAAIHLAEGGHCYFLKGRGSEDELTAARKEWNITIERVPSATDPAATILHLSEVSRGSRTG